LVCLIACCFASSARGQTFERLVMPGPLAKAHADLESDCAKCHAPFKRAEQGPLCLACHDHAAVAADVREKRGFHGTAPSVAAAECRSCHAEHKGRDADIVGLERDAFRHQFTDYALHGAHARVACEACHPAGKPYRDAFGVRRLSRVRRRAPRKARQGLQELSHRDAVARGGVRSRQDGLPARGPTHGRRMRALSSGRALRGHAEGLRHLSRRQRRPPRPVRQQVRELPHEQRLEDAELRPRAQDGLPAHRQARVDRVRGLSHGRPLRPEALDGRLSCHRADDVHEGRNGKDCASCHGTSSWKTVKFDHDRNTEFPLRGAHRALSCETCHTRPVHEQKLGTDCVACHRGDDPHEGQLGADCARCHGESAWKEKVAFDHDLARFPLLGLHAVVSCEECHATPAYRGTERACNACHAKDDTHQRRLGPSCELCHTPNGWQVWRFDHAAQTDFPLRGAHAEVGCENCHTEPVVDEISLAKGCNACHGAEDPHRGSFGTNCGQCHGEQSWRDVRITR
jgi:hypothetical protein